MKRISFTASARSPNYNPRRIMRRFVPILFVSCTFFTHEVLPYLNTDLKTRPCCENAFRSFRRTEGLDCDLLEILRNTKRISPRGYIKLLFLSPDLIYLISFPKAHARATVDRDGHAPERIQRNGSARQSSVTDPRGSEGPESTSGGQANGVPVRKPGTSTF